jgi:hypothetical protein
MYLKEIDCRAQPRWFPSNFSGAGAENVLVNLIVSCSTLILVIALEYSGQRNNIYKTLITFGINI